MAPLQAYRTAMIAILSVVLPVFLVIGVGVLAAKRAVLPEAGIDALIQFTTRIAVPALLFSKMYELDLARAFQPGMILSFYIGAFVVFGLGFAISLRIGLAPPQAVSIGFIAYFSNTVLIGLPVMQSAYGKAAQEPMFGLIAFHAPLLFAFGMVAMEIARRRELGGAGLGDALRRAGASIIRNALMIGILAGLTLNIAGAPLPTPVFEAVKLLAQAALPAALFALGAALTRYSVEKEIGLALAISALALIVHPGIAYVLGAYVFELDAPFLRAAVVTAAMPSGLNTYVFAAMHRQGESAAASAVVLSTALSVLSISLWLAILGGAA